MMAFRSTGLGHDEFHDGAIQLLMVGIGKDELDLVRSRRKTNHNHGLGARVRPMPWCIIDSDVDVSDPG